MGDDALTIWIGGLPEGIREKEIRREYERFGTILQVQIRDMKGPGASFAYVQFTDRSHAEEAKKRTDQAKLFGMPSVKVAWSGDRSASNGNAAQKTLQSHSRSGTPRRRSRSCSRPLSERCRRKHARQHDSGNERGHDSDRSCSPGGKGVVGRGRSRSKRRVSYQSPPRSTRTWKTHGVIVENLPKDMDLRDFEDWGISFASRGKCEFARVNLDRTGLLQFTSVDDMCRAIEGLDGRRFAGCRDRLKAYEDRALRCN